VRSGLEADMQWHHYQAAGDQELKAELITYNLDDLGSLVRAVGCLRACAAGQPHDTAEPAHEVLESIRSGTATAGLPAPIAEAFHHDAPRVLGKRRIVIDRRRHHDRKTKARRTFPGAGRGINTRTAIARVDACTPVAA
jgi:hypothetical protein